MQYLQLYLFVIFSEKDDEALQKLTSFVRAATCSVCSKPQYDKEGEINHHSHPSN
jgi:hypothetical protein